MSAPCGTAPGPSTVTARGPLSQTEAVSGGAGDTASGGAGPDTGPETRAEARAEVRVGDDERRSVIELLRLHTAEGRLTLDEFSERVGLALAATLRADLEPLVADLPAQSSPVPDSRRRRATRWVVAIMSGSARKGRWRTGSDIKVVAVMGGAELDFRQAEIDSDEVVVTAVAVMGGIDITVPEGIDVELTGVPILGGKHLRVADVPVLPGSPRIRIRAVPIMGGVNVRSKPDRAGRDRGGRGIRDRVETDGSALGGAGGGAPGPGGHMSMRPPLPGSLPAGGRVNPLDILAGPLPESLGRQLERAERRARDARHRADRHLRHLGMWTEPQGADLAGMPTAPDGTVTILFTDIAGFTEMTERLGDRAVLEVVRRFQEIVRGQLAAYGGYEVKVQGDGFMSAFAGASRALRCAIAIQRAVDDDARDGSTEPIAVHQGLHTGEALPEQGDFIGHTVNLASRIAGEAGSGEILVSSLLRELADGTREFRFGPSRLVELKGLTAGQTLYPVEWRP